MVSAFESGQHSMEEKNYRAALVYFGLAIAGSTNPSFAHFQRARAYALLKDKKGTLAELRMALAGGFHDASALDAQDFEALRGLTEFQALVKEWKAVPGSSAP